MSGARLTYAEKLLDPRWQRKRLDILSQRGWKCELCENAAETLHVHHEYYVANRLPWEYPDFAYTVLCASHHYEAAKELDDIRELFGSVGMTDFEVAMDAFGPQLRAFATEFKATAARFPDGELLQLLFEAMHDARHTERQHLV